VPAGKNRNPAQTANLPRANSAQTGIAAQKLRSRVILKFKSTGTPRLTPFARRMLQLCDFEKKQQG